MSAAPTDKPSPTGNSGAARRPDPNRFSVSKGTLRLDAFMTRFIFAGGLSVLVAIGAIFVFILAEILPLFQGAKVREIDSIPVGDDTVLMLGVDEWGELPFVVREDGRIEFFDVAQRSLYQTVRVPLPEGTAISSISYAQGSQSLVVGLDSGKLLLGSVRYLADIAEDGSRNLQVAVNWDPVYSIADGQALQLVDGYVGDSRKAVAAISGSGADAQVTVLSLAQQRSLFGVSGWQIADRSDLTAQVNGVPLELAVGSGADILVVRTERGTLYYFHWQGGSWQLRQEITPFDGGDESIASMHFIQGEVSLSVTSDKGSHVLYSLYHQEEFGDRRFGMTKAFDPLPEPLLYSTNSLRNKSILIATESALSLRFATTAVTRFEKQLEPSLRLPVLNGKGDMILGVTDTGDLRLLSLRDPHPEAGFRAFFGKIWYEGQDHAQYIWQSTGGSDDFEPKLSLIPLITGSLKGTFYALILAIPIALLAAVYTSQFLHPNFKRVIKPTIEIMASLPSVVLGFLGALWLAPLLENRVPSVLLMVASIPIAAVLIGYAWSRLPIRFRILVPSGFEAMVFIPVIALAGFIAWQLGPLVEGIFFTYTDPATGESFGDFRLWWEAWSGSQFQQRNAMIVGFMMGFAVIPIIFTITDDALSAVPASLTSASLALGASRWQTAARIVLPTASAGIFSACMIGLGRAVGETMIVVMATGNTPIMDFDIFSGMRTLSANIAVELPEAPHGGTLYRTLFLGAFVLFVLTFAINTVAEILRHRLRDRYKMT
jgi:phosphate transport system permease protein